MIEHGRAWDKEQPWKMARGLSEQGFTIIARVGRARSTRRSSRLSCFLHFFSCLLACFRCDTFRLTARNTSMQLEVSFRGSYVHVDETKGRGFEVGPSSHSITIICITILVSRPPFRITPNPLLLPCSCDVRWVRCAYRQTF
jgi:hypothetical protein